IEFNTYYSVVYHNPPKTGLAFAGSNFPQRPPLNQVLDYLFNQDVPDSVLQNTKASIGKYQQQQTSCPVTRPYPRVLRFKPCVPLVPNTPFSFSFDAGPDLKYSGFFTPYDLLASQNPTVVAAGPVGDNVPQNSAISILFSEPVFSIPGGVKLVSGSIEVPLPVNAQVGSAVIWTSEQGLLLQPPGFLKAGATYTVTISGFENAAGIPVADRTWSFRVGSGVDITPPTLLRALPAGTNVSRDAAAAFLYDKPIAPDQASQYFGVRYSDNDPALPYRAVITDLGFSEDLRTVYLRPHTQWPAGAALQPFVPNSVRDMSGNTPINV